MGRDVIFVFIWVMAVLIIYILLNTVFGEYIFPTFDDIANQSKIESGGFMNYTRYQARSNMIKSVFDYVFAIMIILPFAYLFIKYLLKREPEPQQQYYYREGY